MMLRCSIFDNYTSSINYETLVHAKSDRETHKTDKPIRKKVRFSNICYLILIPTCEEYANLGLLNIMWFSHEEFQKIKAEALEDIRNYHEAYNKLNQQSNEQANQLTVTTDDESFEQLKPR